MALFLPRAFAPAAGHTLDLEPLTRLLAWTSFYLIALMHRDAPVRHHAHLHASQLVVVPINICRAGCGFVK